MKKNIYIMYVQKKRTSYIIIIVLLCQKWQNKRSIERSIYDMSKCKKHVYISYFKQKMTEHAKKENFTYFSPWKPCECKFDWVCLWNLVPVQRMVKFTSTCIFAYTCFHIELRAQHEKPTRRQHVKLGTQGKHSFYSWYLKVNVWSVSISVLKEAHLLLSLKPIIRLFRSSLLLILKLIICSLSISCLTEIYYFFKPLQHLATPKDQLSKKTLIQKLWLPS